MTTVIPMGALQGSDWGRRTLCDVLGPTHTGLN